VLEERDDLEAEYVRLIVRHGIRAMPAFLPSTLTDADLRALTDYLTR
jgi:mono/diheme cytochrome c family protein